MRFLCLLLVLVSSTAYAQLDVQVKKARSVVTAVTTEVIRLETEDGVAIGREVTRELDPVVRPGQPAVIIIVKPDRPADQIELIKLKCETAEVHPIADAPGYFGISKPGKHSVSINVFGKNPFSWDDKTILVEVGQGPNPPPVPPVPPGPTPGPSPIDGDGLRVLMIYETGERMDPVTEEAIFGTEVDQYLKANCAKVDGHPEFRRLDQDAKFTDPNHRFAKALARPRASVPWLIISNGQAGYEGPFPGGASATLELLRSFTPTGAK